MKNSSNLNISCKVVFSLNNSSASLENLSSSERARGRARTNHAINDAQKGCAMQLNGITLSIEHVQEKFYFSNIPVGQKNCFL